MTLKKFLVYREVSYTTVYEIIADTEEEAISSATVGHGRVIGNSKGDPYPHENYLAIEIEEVEVNERDYYATHPSRKAL